MPERTARQPRSPREPRKPRNRGAKPDLQPLDGRNYPPTERQLRALHALAQRAGVAKLQPRSRGEASAEIRRLKALTREPNPQHP